MSDHSRVNSSPTRNPFSALARRKLDDERYHYLPVQGDSKDWESSLPDYLQIESPTRPGEPMYEIVADGAKGMEERAMTGASNNYLLRCTKEDEAAVLKMNHDEAERIVKSKHRAKLVDRDGKEYESETQISQGVLTP